MSEERPGPPPETGPAISAGRRDLSDSVAPSAGSLEGVRPGAGKEPGRGDHEGDLVLTVPADLPEPEQPVAAIVWHEQAADLLQERSDGHRFEAARLMYEQTVVEGVETQRSLAEKIGKSQQHVSFCIAVHKIVLDYQGSENRSWSELYREAKQGPVRHELTGQSEYSRTVAAALALDAARAAMARELAGCTPAELQRLADEGVLDDHEVSNLDGGGRDE